MVNKLAFGVIDLFQEDKNKKGQTLAFFGLNYANVEVTGLALRIVHKTIKTRKGLHSAIRLSHVPVSAQNVLYSISSFDELKDVLVKECSVHGNILEAQRPLFMHAMQQKCQRHPLKSHEIHTLTSHQTHLLLSHQKNLLIFH